MSTQALKPPPEELELHDIQFQLCEFDKYSRAAAARVVLLVLDALPPIPSVRLALRLLLVPSPSRQALVLSADQVRARSSRRGKAQVHVPTV